MKIYTTENDAEFISQNMGKLVKVSNTEYIMMADLDE